MQLPNPPEPNSRRGYPELSGNKLILHDEPQYEGQLFLPGYTLGSLATLNTVAPYAIEGQSAPETNSTLEFHAIKQGERWHIDDTFSFYANCIATLVAGAAAYNKSDGVEAFRFAVGQSHDIEGRAPHLKRTVWHFDFPWFPETGWWVYAANVDTTLFALEPHRYTSGIAVDDYEINPASVWRPEPGEVVILDYLTAHIRPRCYRRRVPRTILSLAPDYTLSGSPRKARPGLLNKADIDEASGVPTDRIIQVAA